MDLRLHFALIHVHPVESGCVLVKHCSKWQTGVHRDVPRRLYRPVCGAAEAPERKARVDRVERWRTETWRLGPGPREGLLPKETTGCMTFGIRVEVQGIPWLAVDMELHAASEAALLLTAGVQCTLACCS